MGNSAIMPCSREDIITISTWEKLLRRASGRQSHPRIWNIRLP